MNKILRCNSQSSIRDLDQREPVLQSARHTNLAPWPIVLNGVGEEVDQNLTEPFRIR